MFMGSRSRINGKFRILNGGTYHIKGIPIEVKSINEQFSPVLTTRRKQLDDEFDGAFSPIPTCGLGAVASTIQA